MNIKYRILRCTYGNVIKPVKSLCRALQYWSECNGYEKYSPMLLTILCFMGLVISLFFFLLITESIAAIIVSIDTFSFSLKTNLYVLKEILIPYGAQFLLSITAIKLIALTLQWTVHIKKSFPSKVIFQLLKKVF